MVRNLWDILKTSPNLNEKALSSLKVGEMDPSEKMAHVQQRAEGENFLRDHPVNHMNIVNHFKEATPEELHHGKTWYADAQHFNKVLAHDTGVSETTMAGLTANYSPQNDWHSNMLLAARVAKHRIAIGGKGQEPYEGVKAFAGEDRKRAAEKILNGEHYDTVLKGSKIRNFGHLVENGGDANPKHPNVAVDRHALSVALGARVSDAAFGMAGLANKKNYNHVAGAYIHATNHLNKESGAKLGDPNYIHPHQVQAVAWLVRQRKNSEEDAASATKKRGNWAKNRSTSKDRWHKYMTANHPSLSGVFESEDE